MKSTTGTGRKLIFLASQAKFSSRNEKSFLIKNKSSVCVCADFIVYDIVCTVQSIILRKFSSSLPALLSPSRIRMHREAKSSVLFQPQIYLPSVSKRRHLDELINKAHNL